MSIRHRLAAVLAIVVTSLALLASPSSAVDSPGYTAPPPEDPVVSTVPRAASRTSAATGTATEARQRLPITGSDMFGLAVIGVVLVGGGAVLVQVRRRAAEAAPTV